MCCTLGAGDSIERKWEKVWTRPSMEPGETEKRCEITYRGNDLVNKPVMNKTKMKHGIFISYCIFSKACLAWTHAPLGNDSWHKVTDELDGGIQGGEMVEEKERVTGQRETQERVRGHSEAIPTRNRKRWRGKKHNMTNLIKVLWIVGLVLGKGLSGPAHLHNPLQGVRCTRVFFLSCRPKTVQQSWAQVSQVCGGGPSPVDAWWFSQVWACTFQFGGK